MLLKRNDCVGCDPCRFCGRDKDYFVFECDWCGKEDIEMYEYDNCHACFDCITDREEDEEFYDHCVICGKDIDEEEATFSKGECIYCFTDSLRKVSIEDID